MESAYKYGLYADKENKRIDKILDQGTKDCPARPDFNAWFSFNILGTIKKS